MYNVLVQMYRELGWNALLELRSRVFLTSDEDEEDSSDEQVAGSRRPLQPALDTLFRSLYVDIAQFEEFSKDLETYWMDPNTAPKKMATM